MKQTRKKILNMDFIQNTKTNSDFNIILFSTQTKITVFTPLSDVDNSDLARQTVIAVYNCRKDKPKK